MYLYIIFLFCIFLRMYDVQIIRLGKHERTYIIVYWMCTYFYVCTIYIFLGAPWSSHAWNSAYNMHAKSTMLMLLKYAQETLGCELIASADVSSKLAYEEERAYS